MIVRVVVLKDVGGRSNQVILPRQRFIVNDGLSGCAVEVGCEQGREQEKSRGTKSGPSQITSPFGRRGSCRPRPPWRTEPAIFALQRSWRRWRAQNPKRVVVEGRRRKENSARPVKSGDRTNSALAMPGRMA